MGLFPISVDDKLACIEREIKMRERVYPRWVADGRMTAEKAEHELAVMKEVWSDYKSGLKVLTMPEIIPEHLRELIARHTTATIENCAQVAEKFENGPLRFEIAAAIRKLKTTQD